MPVAPRIRGPRRGPGGAPEGPRRGPGGAREGPRRGPGGALRFLGTSNSDFVDFDGFYSVFFQILTVFKHVEVGSSPKEPDFDLFARVGRRGGPKGVPPLCCRKGHESLRICNGRGPDSEGPTKSQNTKKQPWGKQPEYFHLFLEKPGGKTLIGLFTCNRF